MMKHSYPTLEPMRFLLEMIHNRAMALPDFHRDFVWDPYATTNDSVGVVLQITSAKFVPSKVRPRTTQY